MTPSRRSFLAISLGGLAPYAAMGAETAPALPASLAELERMARADGRIASLGMPDDWANWRGTWSDLQRLYGLAHSDSDMSSAEELAKIEAERANASADIGDVGFEFGAIAKSRGLTRAYKPSSWTQIPDWAKDPDGHWALAYTGTIAFAVNRRRQPQGLRTWRELFASSSVRVMVGEVGRAAQANAAVLSAAVALGGDETHLAPALQAFGALARSNRLTSTNPSPVLMERAEADVFLLWDFNGLAYRAKLPNAADYEVLVPGDGSVTSGYTTIINRWSSRPYAAMLAREYIFSDAGQINLARGHARPIRVDHLKLPTDLQGTMVDSTQYAKARAIRPALWSEEAKKLPRAWQAAVLART